MIAFSVAELFLLVWAVVATIVAVTATSRVKEAVNLLTSAAQVTRQLLTDDAYRNDLRAKFGLGEVK